MVGRGNGGIWVVARLEIRCGVAAINKNVASQKYEVV
jgi:hypothetical protein